MRNGGVSYDGKEQSILALNGIKKSSGSKSNMVVLWKERTKNRDSYHQKQTQQKIQNGIETPTKYNIAEIHSNDRI